MDYNNGASRLARHELYRAYEIIFRKNVRGAGIIIEREVLAQAFKERAYQFRPDRAKELGKPKRELQEAVKAIAMSFDILAEIVGQNKRVWVSSWVDNTRPDSAKAWSPKRVDPNSVVSKGQALTTVEEASIRIKEAIAKLKKQTESLAKNRSTEVPADTAAKSKPQKQEPATKSLILGRHLHRRGLISLRQLIAAVAWQRQQRPAVGQIAKSWGILTDNQIFDILREKENGELFCDSAVRRGLMTPFQRLAVVGRQRVMQKPIGQYFIDQGILSQKQIEEEVEQLQASRNIEQTQ